MRQWLASELAHVQSRESALLSPLHNRTAGRVDGSRNTGELEKRLFTVTSERQDIIFTVVDWKVDGCWMVGTTILHMFMSQHAVRLPRCPGNLNLMLTWRGNFLFGSPEIQALKDHHDLISLWMFLFIPVSLRSSENLLPVSAGWKSPLQAVQVFCCPRWEMEAQLLTIMGCKCSLISIRPDRWRWNTWLNT